MQTITSLPKEFFENITFHPLDHRAGKFNISTDGCYVFGCEDKFRGVKEAFAKGTPPFYLLHEETFDVTKKVFKGLFNKEPDKLTFFCDEEKTWNAFIVGSSESVRYEQGTISETKDGRDTIDISPSSEDFLHFPLIGGFNSYGYDKNPAFFYLIATPFRQSSGSFLTLDNFRFSKDEDKKPFVFGNRVDATEALIKKITKRFESAESDFEKLLKNIQAKSIHTEAFAPVVLDLYNRNRNLQSILNDDQLRYRVKRLYVNAEQFTGRRKGLPWTEFIHFIIRYNQFFFNRVLLFEHIEQLFTRKESYQKFVRLFGQFSRDKNDERFQNYVKNQVNDWKRVENAVLHMPAIDLNY